MLTSTAPSNQPSNPPFEGLSFSPRTIMPERLVLVRHGESEGNVIQKAMRKGIIKEYPAEYLKLPDRELRLTPQGREQAIRTGPWLREQYPEGFDVIYVSDHVRAKETAALICRAAGWDTAAIRVDPQLGERSRGRFVAVEGHLREEIVKLTKRDPLHAPMPDGETLLETRARSRILLERAAREFSGKRVLVFSHGEYIEAIWSEIAHHSTESQREFFQSDGGSIRNCQVIEFASTNPVSGEVCGKLRWVRSSCPQENRQDDWARIQLSRFSPEDLLSEVNNYPLLNVALPASGQNS